MRKLSDFTSFAEIDEIDWQFGDWVGLMGRGTLLITDRLSPIVDLI